MPSSAPAVAPLLRFALPDRRPATLLLGDASAVLSIDDALVSSWDLAGRPYALVRETGTYRRGLDGRLLWKREATAEGPRVRQRLSAIEGEPVVEAARADAALALAALSSRATSVCPVPRDPPAPASADPSSPDSNGAANEQAFTEAFPRGRRRRFDVPGKRPTRQVIAQGDPRSTRVGTRDDMSQAVRRLRAIVAMDVSALRDVSTTRVFAPVSFRVPTRVERGSP